MTRYLLAIHQPDGDPPPPAILDEVMRDVAAVDAEMRSAGVWVFAGGLHPPGTATVVQARGSEVLLTDGPFTEGKEHLGGLTVISVPDLDAALEWAAKLAKAITLPIEVRPFHGEG